MIARPLRVSAEHEDFVQGAIDSRTPATNQVAMESTGPTVRLKATGEEIEVFACGRDVCLVGPPDEPEKASIRSREELEPDPVRCVVERHLNRKWPAPPEGCDALLGD